MGEYVKHPLLREEVKIGVFRSPKDIEAFYPKWVLEKFLISGYEPKRTIQSFLDKADIVNWTDYKHFGSSKLLEVAFIGERYESMKTSLDIAKTIEELVAEGYLILLKVNHSSAHEFTLWTTEYGKPFVKRVALENEIVPIFYQNRWLSGESGEIQVGSEVYCEKTGNKGIVKAIHDWAAKIKITEGDSPITDYYLSDLKLVK